MPIKFYEENIKSGLKNRRKLGAFIEQKIFQHLNQLKSVHIDYIFCTDEYLVQINRQFLGHDTYTDIITFDLSDDTEELRGEIYISVERVRENAIRFSTKFPVELQRVLFHGALHLCGFKDKNEKDKLLMRQKEDEWIESYADFIKFIR